MSARNYILSAREKNHYNKGIEYLPNISGQRYGCRAGTELPPLSGSKTTLINRNLGYSFQVEPFCTDRAGTPLSDFFSESESGTPDFRSEESDSSAGSTLRNNTDEASRTIALEWDRIERTLYDEDGEKTSRPLMLEECKQWRELHPQLRIVGKAIQLPEKKLPYKQIEHEEIIAIHYSDRSVRSDSEDRVSESSNDVTPQNSPRFSYSEDIEPRLSREKVQMYTKYEERLPDSFCSLLQISPMNIRSPPRKRLNSSIIKSEIASSRWMRTRPDSSTNYERNSAKSFMSLDTTNLNNSILSASEERKRAISRVVTAKNRDMSKLQPLYSPDTPPHEFTRLPMNTTQNLGFRKVSLPPLLFEEERKKVMSIGSAKKSNMASTRNRKSGKRSVFHLDRIK